MVQVPRIIITPLDMWRRWAFKRTGRKCTEPGCKGRLKDFILDWEDALPEDELTASEEAASAADLAICLGTSLQITPACDLPLRTPQGRQAADPC